METVSLEEVEMMSGEIHGKHESFPATRGNTRNRSTNAKGKESNKENSTEKLVESKEKKWKIKEFKNLQM